MMDQYILDELSDADKKTFELHFFECDSCFQKLKKREQLIYLIQKEGHNIFPEYISEERKA